MKRICPSCRSTNVRRSSTPAPEITWRNDFLSRYRCRDCKLEFSVISRRTYQIAAAVGASIIVIVLVVFLIGLLASPDSPSPARQRRSDGQRQAHELAAADTRFDGLAGKAL
jgi:tetrahydromethanopterin S-methyltransferase subunit F